MSTPKKKHLIELMIEAGVKWPDGAEYAAQDKDDRKLHFYSDGCPNLPPGAEFWAAHNCDVHIDEAIKLEILCRNWNRTIVTREQYAEALAQRRTENFTAIPPESLMCRCAAAPLSSSIEQLTSDYHAKAAEADRLQSVADEALKAADDALIALEKAGELIGLVISIDAKPKQAEQPDEPEQPEITDWRDLQVGDVVEAIRPHNDNSVVGEQGVVVEISNDGFFSNFPSFGNYYYFNHHFGDGSVIFIRRP